MRVSSERECEYQENRERFLRPDPHGGRILEVCERGELELKGHMGLNSGAQGTPQVQGYLSHKKPLQRSRHRPSVEDAGAGGPCFFIPARPP